MKSFLEWLDGNSDKITIYFADWCPPCRMVKPKLKELEQEFGKMIRFDWHDIGAPVNGKASETDEMQRAGLHRIPTVIVQLGGRKEIFDTVRVPYQLAELLHAHFGLVNV